MFDLFDTILNPLNWDKDFYKFNREEKDMHPYSVQADKNGNFIIVHNILGINKEDIKLTKEIEGGNTYILLTGSTKDSFTGKTYSVNSRFALDDKQLDLSSIKAQDKNGLLYIIIASKKVEEKKVNSIAIN